VHRVEIDCGEAGKQVFEAKTTAELIAKLMVAQKHATIKIRDLSQRLTIVAGLATRRTK
jgi:hypothetical protein